MRLLSALLFYADLQRNDAVEIHLFRQVVFFQQLGTAAVGAEAGVCKVEAEHGFRNLFQLKVVALLRQLLLRIVRSVEGEFAGDSQLAARAAHPELARAEVAAVLLGL